ncbi:MAG: hypothetical protein RRY12_10770 [Cloacibacillus sp.]
MANVYQGSFASGEITPELYGRVDLQRYQSALARLKNFTCHVYGGVSRRPGTIYLGDAKNANKKCRLLPFEYKAASGQTYAMEFGDYYIRFWTPDGIILNDNDDIYELLSPYSEAELEEITCVQSADTVFLFHPDHQPQRLMRSGHASWSISPFVTSGGPFLDENTTDTTIMPTISGAVVTLTASAALFSSRHVGGEFRIRQRVSEVDDTDIIASKTDVSGTLGPITVWGEWELVTTGQGPTVSDWWSGTIVLYRRYAGGDWQTLRSFTVDKDRELAITGTEDEDFAEYKATYTIKTNEKSTTTNGATTTSLSSMTVQLHCKSHTKIGSVRISSVSSGTVALGTEIVAVGQWGAATALWAEPAWGGDYGFPRCGAFYQDRLFMAGSRKQPQTIWASKVGSYDQFGVSDPIQQDDGITRTLVSRKMSEILSFVPLDILIVLTSGTEYRISSTDGVVSAINFDARAQSYYGSANVTPEVLANHVFFVQKTSREVRDMSYSWESDSYHAEILSLLSRHLLEERKVVDLGWQLWPDSILWCITDDGKLLGCTYLQEQEVTGWHQHETGGFFESLCCVGGDGQTDVYFSVLRNGARRIERLSPKMEGNARDSFYVDSGLTYEGAAVSTVSGLEHLNGMAVSILADGNVEPLQVVESGCVTLTKAAAASKITVGLPYSSELETLDLEYPNTNGAYQGTMKRVVSAKIRFLNSRGGEFGGSFEKMDTLAEHRGTQSGECLLLQSGIKEIIIPADWGKGGHVCIRQTDPLPMNILAISPEVKQGG